MLLAKRLAQLLLLALALLGGCGGRLLNGCAQVAACVLRG